MPTLTSEMRTYLRGDADILAQVGPRIRSQKLDQGETLPAIRLAIAGGSDEEHLGGGSDLAHAILQIDAYAVTSEAADTLAELIRLRMRIGRTMLDTVMARGISMTGNLRHHTEPIDDGGNEYRYIASRDYRISYAQPTS